MNRIISCLAVFVLLECSISRAQEPVVHTIDFPKGDIAWSVIPQNGGIGTVAAPDGVPAVETRSIKRIDIIRSGNLRRDLVLWSDQKTTEYWWSVNPFFVVFTNKPDGPILTMKGAMMDVRRFDESNFSWISAATYAGLQTLGGKQCRFYEEKSVDPDTESESLQRVWIDLKTSKPAAWGDGSFMACFMFSTPDPTKLPLVVPDKYLTAMRRYAAHLTAPKKSARR